MLPHLNHNILKLIIIYLQGQIDPHSFHILILIIFPPREGNAGGAMGQTKLKTSENNKYHMGAKPAKYQIN